MKNTMNMTRYNKIFMYFGISILFFERLDFSEFASLTIFLIGEAVNFTASVTGGLSFLSSLLLLQMLHILNEMLYFHNIQ